MNIEQFIEFVVDLADDVLYDKLDGKAKLFFIKGGCYEFAKVIKEYISKSQIVINKNSDHCAISYNGNIYDATGKINDLTDFKVADSEDIKYMEARFGIPELQYVNNLTISDFLIKEIKECNIIDSLELEEEEEER